MSGQGKNHDPFVPIHNEVFEHLTIRWPYSLAAGRVAWYIARWSWGWKRGRMTRHPLNTGMVAEATGLNIEVVRRALRQLQSDGVVIRDRRGRAGLDKRALKRRCYHMVTQNATIWSRTNYHMVAHGSGKPMAQQELRKPTDNIQTTDKLIAPASPGFKGKTAGQIDNDRQVESVLLLWKQATGSPPVTGSCRNPHKLAQKALTRCRAIDLSPVVVIGKLHTATGPPWKMFMSLTKPGGKARAEATDGGQSFADWLRQITPEMPVSAPERGKKGKPEAIVDILARMGA